MITGRMDCVALIAANRVHFRDSLQQPICYIYRVRSIAKRRNLGVTRRNLGVAALRYLVATTVLASSYSYSYSCGI